MVIESTELVYTIPEAGALLGLSRPSAYAAARKGELPIIRFGRRAVVPRVALQRLLAEVKPTKGGIEHGQ